MLSVTDNSQGARGDVSSLAAPSPNSEVLISIVLAGSCSPGGLHQFIGPNLEADKRVGCESLGNGNVSGIAALREVWGSAWISGRARL